MAKAMDDLISRQGLIDNVNKFAQEHYTALVNDIIMKQPLKDMVEVVRCKDCRWSKDINDGKRNHLFCGIVECLFADDDYCSCGERKEHD